jgi:hypothetical protein
MKTFLSSLVLVLAGVGAAQASTVDWANNVIEFKPGAQGTIDGTPGNNNVDVSALGAPDGQFVSLGNGGFIVLDFPGGMKAGATIVVERTNGCTGPVNDLCTQWPEAAEVFVGSDWQIGKGATFALANAENNFISVGTVKNGGSDVVSGSGSNSLSRSVLLNVLTPFSQIVLVDRTAGLPGHQASHFSSNGGFDVDAVGATPVPGPAALPLIATGLAVFGLMRRRRGA